MNESMSRITPLEHYARQAQTQSPRPPRIGQALRKLEITSVRSLLVAYAREWPGGDLGTEGFKRELVNLPGTYSPPDGSLLIAWDGRRAVGCVGIRRLRKGICEIKRLYVIPAARGRGIGRQLMEKAIARARRLGYLLMRLDTDRAMRSAQDLYESLGFCRILRSHSDPARQQVYFELRLTPG